MNMCICVRVCVYVGRRRYMMAYLAIGYRMTAMAAQMDGLRHRGVGGCTQNAIIMRRDFVRVMRTPCNGKPYCAAAENQLSVWSIVGRKLLWPFSMCLRLHMW